LSDSSSGSQQGHFDAGVWETKRLFHLVCHSTSEGPEANETPDEMPGP
jgi:hypothetical protein